jgi:ribosome biogenesis GTPase A
MKITLSNQLKKIANLLKELEEPLGYLGTDTSVPTVIKTSLHKILSGQFKESDLEKVHDDIKTAIKVIKPGAFKEMLRYLVLMPIQIRLKKIDPVNFPNYERKRKDFIQDLKQSIKIKEREQKTLETIMNEGLTKGAPSHQILHGETV